ncbi:uncharacterized protein LOC62_06G008803 [Vanrija pseudolonga]|uniref:Transcription factor domain-containing protein n=1 Tax=Vanrija pseudolonga TaxID=143232 RepID=A0AAF1BLQ0_9TREE|nr:hypothetical protein LOC62_06G008803 [Vanrija pseudolonga]
MSQASMTMSPARPPPKKRKTASSSSAAKNELIPRPPGVHKRGKRIVTLLQQHQQSQLAQSSSAMSTADNGERSHDQSGSGQQLASVHGGIPAASPEDAAAGDRRVPCDITPNRAWLLRVPGLTRHALDDCINTFFTSIGQTYHLSQPRDYFLRRVRVMLYDVGGLDIPHDLADVPASSELLALAVACLGSPLSSHPQLAQSIHNRCVELAADSDHLAHGGLDAVEAMNLLAERFVRPRHALVQSRQSIVLPARTPAGLGEAQNAKLHPLQLDPLGKGFAIDLALYHKLNVPPISRNDADTGYQRREALFWTLWKFDALRSASASVACRLSDVNIGWPLPSDAAQDPHMNIARVARQICTTLLSVRAKVQGLTVAHVHEAIAALDELPGRCINIDPSSLAREAIEVASSERKRRDSLDRRDTPQHSAFLLSSHNWLYLVCWIAVKENAAKHSDFPAETMAMVDVATMQATRRMAALAQTITKHDLMQRAPRAVRDHMAAFVLLLVRRLTENAATSAGVAAQYFALAETLASAVRSASSYPDSSMLANVLCDAVYRASSAVALVETSGERRLRQCETPVQPSDTAPPQPLLNSFPVLPPSSGEDVATRESVPTQDATPAHLAAVMDPQISPLTLPSMGGYFSAFSLPAWDTTTPFGMPTSGGDAPQPTLAPSLSEPPRTAPLESSSTVSTTEPNEFDFGLSPTEPFLLDQELLDLLSGCGIEIPFFGGAGSV